MVCKSYIRHNELVEYFFCRFMDDVLYHRMPDHLQKEYRDSMWDFAEEKATNFENYFNAEEVDTNGTQIGM